jgi:hypothetical protein
MKIIVALLFTASLMMACGGKAKKTPAPANNATGTETKIEGTGGATYGGTTPPPAEPPQAP